MLVSKRFVTKKMSLKARIWSNLLKKSLVENMNKMNPNKTGKLNSEILFLHH